MAELVFMKNTRLFFELFKILASSVTFLDDKPEETTESCLTALWHKATGFGVSAAASIYKPLDPLTPESEEKLRLLIEARLRGEPLAYLTERQQFMGLEFISTPQAVIPRKDTEPLAKAVGSCIRTSLTPPEQLIVIDVFTGSGNVPLSLSILAPGPRYFGSDLSEEAIKLAKRNASHLKLASTCTFFCGDLLAPFACKEFYGNVDIISGSPPFISSAKVHRMPREISQHEPALAFDAGPFGVSLFLRLITDAPLYLKTGGWLFFEVGVGQSSGVLKRLENDPRYCNPQTFCDDKGEIRVVAAQKSQTV